MTGVQTCALPILVADGVASDEEQPMANTATPMIKSFFGKNSFMADTSGLARRAPRKLVWPRLRSAETTPDYKLEWLPPHEGERYALR